MADVTVVFDQSHRSSADLATRLGRINGVSLRFADGPIIDLSVPDSALGAVRALVRQAGGSIHGIAQPALLEPIDPWTAVGHPIEP